MLPPTSVLLQATHAQIFGHWPVFCSAHVLPVGRCPFSGAPLLTPKRHMHRDSVAGWYPAGARVFFLSSDVISSGAPLLTPVRPTHKRFSPWLVFCSARVFSRLGCYLLSGVPFLAPCVPCTDIQPLPGILQCTYSPNSDSTPYWPVFLVFLHCFRRIPAKAVNVFPQGAHFLAFCALLAVNQWLIPTRGVLISITMVWVGLWPLFFAVVVSNSSFFDPLPPDYLMS